MLDLVSIITPTYNSALFIRTTIESVLTQTYSHWELIIVDDGSNDDTTNVVAEYLNKDNRIKYIRLTEPSGSPTKPRNVAIENASGRYIAFLDSDDVWLPHKLEAQLSVFRSDQNVAVVYSDHERMAEDGKRSNHIIKCPKFADYKKLLYGNVIGNLTGIYDTNKVGKVYMQSIGHEDYVMWLSILKQGYIAKNTCSIDAIYRVRSSSVSSNKKQALKWTWNIYRNVEKLSFIRSAYYFIFYAIRAITNIIH